MEWRWIEEAGSFKDVASSWDAAVVESGCGNPFLLSDFIFSWWSRYHELARLRIFAVISDGKVRAGIPLAAGTGAGFGSRLCRVMKHVGGVAANYTEPFRVVPEVPLARLFLEALARRKDWDALHLTDVREGNPLLTDLSGSGAFEGLRTRILQDHMNCAIDLSGGKDRFMARMPGKLKRDLRSKRRYIEGRCGPLALVEVSGREGVEKAFDLYVRFSRASFAGRQRSSGFADERYAAFMKDFMVRMDGAGRLDAHLLKAGDSVLAVSFGYRFGPAFNWVLTGFDYEYKYARPGYLLIEELIGLVERRGETSYNWYGHERFYKSQWCNSLTQLSQLIIANRTAAGRLYASMQYAKSRVRSNERLLALVRNIRERRLAFSRIGGSESERSS